MEGPETQRMRMMAYAAALQKLDPQSPVLRRLGLSVEEPGPRVAQCSARFLVLWSFLTASWVAWLLTVAS